MSKHPYFVDACDEANINTLHPFAAQAISALSREAIGTVVNTDLSDDNAPLLVEGTVVVHDFKVAKCASTLFARASEYMVNPIYRQQLATAAAVIQAETFRLSSDYRLLPQWCYRAFSKSFRKEYAAYRQSLATIQASQSFGRYQTLTTYEEATPQYREALHELLAPANSMFSGFSPSLLLEKGQLTPLRA